MKWQTFRALVLSFVLGQTIVQAQIHPTGWTINPAFHLTLVPMSSGQVWQGTIQGIEVRIKVTRFDTPAGARELAKVEYANVFHLYDERGNPYQGQISQLIICDQKFRPRLKKLKIFRRDANAIFAGASGRQVLGACNADQIANWAAYFNVITPDQLGVIAVRLFRPIAAALPINIKAASARLEQLAPQLLLMDKS